jgi:hypothetical protein
VSRRQYYQNFRVDLRVSRERGRRGGNLERASYFWLRPLNKMGILSMRKFEWEEEG